MTKLWTLGSLDDIMPDIDNCHVLCFACPNSQQAHAKSVLLEAHDCLVRENPVLGGLILPSKDVHLRPGTKVVQSSTTVPRLEIKDGRDEIRVPYDRLKSLDMPRRYLNPSLVMPSRTTLASEVRHTTAVRATFIEGGCFLAFNTSHALMDGTSVVKVMASLAAHASRISSETGPNPDAAPSPRFGSTPSDLETRNPSFSPRQYTELKQNSRSWQMLGLDYRPKEASSAVLAATLPAMTPVTRLFRITGANLGRLKERCFAEAAAEDSAAWVSTADSLAALLWSCIVRARTRDAGGRDTRSTLMTAMDVRRLLEPPVSSDFLGNAVLYSQGSAPTTELAGQLPLGAVARLVRDGLRAHQQPGAIRDALELAAAIPDVSALSLLYPTWLAEDVVISSIYGLPFYNLDWGCTFGGDGRQTPDFFRFPEGVFDGICFVLPRCSDGSAEIQVTMHEPHMQLLVKDAEFRKYFVDVAAEE